MDNENQRELDVLAALEGIHRMQESIRGTELDMVVETELTSTAQVLASAVHLRQQVETAEFTRALIEQQKAAQQPPGGPLAC